jgi:hypothetical protein
LGQEVKLGALLSRTDLDDEQMETAFFGRHLKILKGLTPYEFICQRWMSEPDRLPSTRAIRYRE